MSEPEIQASDLPCGNEDDGAAGGVTVGGRGDGPAKGFFYGSGGEGGAGNGAAMPGARVGAVVSAKDAIMRVG